MPFFSVGYPEKERLEVNLLVTPANLRANSDEWIQALVSVEVVGFKAEVEISMLISDMIRFKDQLEPVYQNLRGKAEFNTLEGQLYILIEPDNLGHIEATGYLLGNVYLDNKLSFEIQFDQTLLWHTISEIDEALFELSEMKE